MWRLGEKGARVRPYVGETWRYHEPRVEQAITRTKVSAGDEAKSQVAGSRALLVEIRVLSAPVSRAL